MTILDILFLVFAIIFFIKGYSKGLVLAILKLFSYILGILVAMNFSAWLSNKLFQEGEGIIAKMFPLISYVILFAGTVIIVNMMAKKVNKVFKIPVVSTFNKLLGGIAYLLLITFIASTFIWLSAKTGIINEQGQTKSVTYKYIEPIAPIVFDNIGNILPFAKNTFNRLDNFFVSLSSKVP